MNLILASTSLYRKELLQRLGIPFITASPQVDETPLPDETPVQLVRRLAVAKARAVARQHRDALIIGGDQVAVLGDRILGKPGDHDCALEQLTLISGHRLQFLNGLCLLNAVTDTFQLEVIPYDVVFRALSVAQIENYLRREQPYQCAGSFKSEALGIALCERFEGEDPTALIGLPLMRLTRMLENEGIIVI